MIITFIFNNVEKNRYSQENRENFFIKSETFLRFIRHSICKRIEKELFQKHFYDKINKFYLKCISFLKNVLYNN